MTIGEETTQESIENVVLAGIKECNLTETAASAEEDMSE